VVRELFEVVAVVGPAVCWGSKTGAVSAGAVPWYFLTGGGGLWFTSTAIAIEVVVLRKL